MADMKRKWRCDLKFWMNAYDQAIGAQRSAIEDNEWFYEHIGSPYNREQKEELFEIDSRIMHMGEVKKYIRKRILNYNI